LEASRGQSDTSLVDDLSLAEDKEEDAVIPCVFDKTSIQETGIFQTLVLQRNYPWLNCEELVEDATHVKMQAARCEPGCNTAQTPTAPLFQVPAAPMHEALEKKMSGIVYHYLARPPKGGVTRGLKPPHTSKLASLTRPHADLKRLVAFKKSVANRVQCSLDLTESETLHLQAFSANKNKLLGSAAEERLAKAKFEALGTMLGAANWVQILTEFANNALKQQPPDVTAAHTALGVISKMNTHGVADGLLRLQTTAVWERRFEVLKTATKMPENLKHKIQELLPTGPGPFRGELTRGFHQRGFHQRIRAVKTIQRRDRPLQNVEQTGEAD
jgi:hypothetical protein